MRNKMLKLWMDKVAPYTVFGGAMMLTGCLSVSLVGGRHQNVTNVISDGNTAEPAMQADSETSDMLKDMLKDLKFPGSGDVSTPVPTPPGTPDVPITPGPDPEPTPDPEPPVEPPVGDSTFLWKPVSENTGNLVVLTPAQLDVVRIVLPDGSSTDEPGTRANGNRQHWRTDRPGSAYGPGEVIAILADGGQESWTITNPGERN